MMARTRLIKPEFFKHGDLFDAEQASGLPLRVAFAGLWCLADKAGRFAWKPREMKLDVLPYDDVDFGAVLDALATAGFIARYVVDGKAYGHIPSWARHQTTHKTERASTLPPPPDNGGLTVNSPLGDGETTAPSRLDTVTVTGTVTDSVGTDPVTKTSISAHTPPSPPRKKPRGARGEPAPWMGRMGTVWRDAYGGGPPTYMARTLRPAVGQYGEDLVAERLAVYCATVPARYADLNKFVATFGTWTPEQLAETGGQHGAGRPGGRPGQPPDPATELLDVLEAGGLLASGRSREAYWRRVGEVAEERGRDPAEFEAIVRTVKPWELGEITWRPDQIAKIRQRIAATPPSTGRQPAATLVGATPEVAA